MNPNSAASDALSYDVTAIELLLRVAHAGLTQVIIEHDMQVVFSVASRISVMANGRVLAEGDPASIRADERVQQAYLGGARL